MKNDTSRTRSFYDSFSGEYAGFTESSLRKHYEWPAIRALLPDVEGARVVDVACGPGDAARRFADRGAEVLGIDLSEDMIRVAKERYGDDVEFRQADLRETLDFVQDGSIDLVHSQLTLGHIEEWEPIIDEFQRILGPDGVVVLSVSHPFSDYLMLQYDGFPAFGGLFGEEDEPIVTSEGDQPCYSDIEPFEGNWGTTDDPDTVSFFRRPLASVCSPLFAGGFCITGMEEPLPSEALSEQSPELADRLRRRPPMFLCIRAEKSQHG